MHRAGTLTPRALDNARNDAGAATPNVPRRHTYLTRSKMLATST